MNRSLVRGFTAAGLFALGGVTLAAVNPNAKPTFESKTPKQPPVIVAPPSGEVLAEAVKAEMDAYVRRLDVCTRLRQIAAETNDDNLLNQADDLERQASTLYQARVSKLGLDSKVPPRNSNSILDQRLGSGSAVDPLSVAPPKPLTNTAGRGSR
ncbi:hypothetical protein BH11PLA2_BH11PLA2_07550 [soil metagenome]